VDANDYAADGRSLVIVDLGRHRAEMKHDGTTKSNGP